MLHLSGIIGAVIGLTRKCPRCGRVQIVSREKRHEPVKCKFCGADVPPKKR